MNKINSIIINKKVCNSKEEARKIAKEIFPEELKNKKYIRETKQSYRVRITPKTKFDYSTFKTYKIKDGVSIVYGKLK